MSHFYRRVSITNNPYEGLKLSCHFLFAPSMGWVSITNNPYEGLKLRTTRTRIRILETFVSITNNPYEGLKQYRRQSCKYRRQCFNY